MCPNSIEKEPTEVDYMGFTGVLFNMKVRCDHCGDKTYSMREWQNHIHQVLDVVEYKGLVATRNLRCSHCSAHFESVSGWKEHVDDLMNKHLRDTLGVL